MSPNLSSPGWTRNIHVTEEITLFCETYPAYSPGQSSAKPIFTFGFVRTFFLHRYIMCSALITCPVATQKRPLYIILNLVLMANYI